MNLNSMQWFDLRILIFMGMSLVLNGLIAFLWHKKFYKKMGLKLPMEAGDGTTYAILTQDECYQFHNIMLSLLG